MDTRNFIGKTVTVLVDRPLGSVHPKHADIVYPVNYGYLEDTKSGDGEELDAYILGVEEELAEFTGEVVAVIHRLDEEDDKLVVVPAGTELSDDQILEETYFQEQYFESEIWR